MKKMFMQSVNVGDVAWFVKALARQIGFTSDGSRPIFTVSRRESDGYQVYTVVALDFRVLRGGTFALRGEVIATGSLAPKRPSPYDYDGEFLASLYSPYTDADRARARKWEGRGSIAAEAASNRYGGRSQCCKYA